MLPSPQNAPHVQLPWQTPGHASSSVPSHSSPNSTVSLPHEPAVQLQFAWHAPGHASSSLPSHSSPGPLITPSPHDGQVQSGLHAPGQLASDMPSQSSPPSSMPLPHCAPLLKMRVGCMSAPG